MGHLSLQSGKWATCVCRVTMGHLSLQGGKWVTCVFTVAMGHPHLSDREHLYLQCGERIYAMVGSIPDDIACGMHYVVYIGIPHDPVVCFFKFCIFLKPWHKKKTKFVWFMASYFTHWESSCITLDLWSHAALLCTQLVKYGPTHHTII